MPAALLNPDAYFRYRARRENRFAMSIPSLGEVLLTGRADAAHECRSCGVFRSGPVRPIAIP